MNGWMAGMLDGTDFFEHTPAPSGLYTGATRVQGFAALKTKQNRVMCCWLFRFFRTSNQTLSYPYPYFAIACFIFAKYGLYDSYCGYNRLERQMSFFASYVR